MKKIFNIFLNISMVQTQDLLGQGHFGPLDLHLKKIGKGLLDNATYKL